MPTQTANRQAALDALDSIGQGREQFDESDTFTLAEQDIERFLERVTANIESADMLVTGGITDFRIVATASDLEIRGNPWLLYQDRGVKGSVNKDKAPNSPHEYTTKMPPREVFVDYIKRKNLNLENEGQFYGVESPFKELTEDEKIEKLAAFMQIYIFKNGFKPRNIFAKEIPELIEDLKVSIKGFGKQMIEQSFLNIQPK